MLRKLLLSLLVSTSMFFTYVTWTDYVVDSARQKAYEDSILKKEEARKSREEELKKLAEEYARDSIKSGKGSTFPKGSADPSEKEETQPEGVDLSFKSSFFEFYISNKVTWDCILKTMFIILGTYLGIKLINKYVK